MNKYLLLDESDGYQAYINQIFIYDEEDDQKVHDIITKYDNDQKQRVLDYEEEQRNIKAAFGCDVDTWYVNYKNGEPIEDEVLNNKINSAMSRLSIVNDERKDKILERLYKDLKSIGEIVNAETFTMDYHY